MFINKRAVFGWPVGFFCWIFSPATVECRLHPEVLRSFTPFCVTANPSYVLSSPFSIADIEHPSLGSTTKLQFMRKLLSFFFFFFFVCWSSHHCNAKIPLYAPDNRSATLLFRQPLLPDLLWIFFFFSTFPITISDTLKHDILSRLLFHSWIPKISN